MCNMEKKYKWIGPSGYNPLIGSVTTGKQIPAVGASTIEKFLAQKVIVEIKTTSKNKG